MKADLALYRKVGGLSQLITNMEGCPIEPKDDEKGQDDDACVPVMLSVCTYGTEHSGVNCTGRAMTDMTGPEVSSFSHPGRPFTQLVGVVSLEIYCTFCWLLAGLNMDTPTFQRGTPQPALGSSLPRDWTRRTHVHTPLFVQPLPGMVSPQTTTSPPPLSTG